MDPTDLVNVDYIGNDKVQQHMLQVNNDITRLLELAKDPRKYGELIEKLDPTIDKVDRHVMALQTRLTEELNRRTKEFEAAIKVLDDPAAMFGSKPPGFLSSADITKWHKLAASRGTVRHLTGFKKILIDNFKSEVSKQLHIEKLTEQNITIRRILDKIRQTLII
ncbi:conserved hypothetical protein [Gammaproteobacteria bacterium]